MTRTDSSSIIRKSAGDFRVTPNWLDYDGERRRFSWDAVRLGLPPQPDGGLNIAWQALDRHLEGPRRDRVAFRFVEAVTGQRDVSYGELAAMAGRICNVLRSLGIGRGERVFLLSPRIPELYAAFFGSLRNGCIVCPLFPAFGPEPIATRVRLGSGAVLVTTDELYHRKVAATLDRMSSLKQVLLIDTGWGTPDAGGGPAAAARLKPRDLATLMNVANEACEPAPTSPDDAALLHFTSGTTGAPKGALHVHGAVATHWATGRYALDLHDDDIYWCTADAGWVTGTSYGAIAPLLHGVTSVVDTGEFDAGRWYGILQKHGVSVWYTAPTAIRMLIQAGAGLARRHAFPRLRFIASVGEPLHPEAIAWGRDVLGLPIHDNWWQTETGGIMIANTPAFDIKPGSMGRPLPGVEAAIVQRGEGGRVELIDAPGRAGELALRRGWPSMFRGYLDEPQRFAKCFSGDWYLTGDLARRDADGYYWFIGRADDLIKSAGHLIGPFEVESALMEHPAVAEAGVIGKPDPVIGERVKAFVSLKNGVAPSEALRRELLGHARKRLGAAVAPREIDFLPQLPVNRSGKIMRRLLKARELGLPEGDTSTLQSGSPGQR